MKQAALKIMEIGPKAVLIKGGHAVQTATDVLYNGYEFIVYEEKKIETKIHMGPDVHCPVL